MLNSVYQMNEPGYYGDAPLQQKGVMERITSILTMPSVNIRCMEITQLIHTTPTVEWRGIYPLLLENIFGWGNYPGWKLKGVRRDLSNYNSDEVFRFLRADGPVLELAYRLMTDPNLCYEFPVSALPNSLQRKITGGDAPPFILNKLSDRMYITHSQNPLNLMLNPFELFFFHYAYLELHQSMEIFGQGAGSGSLAESIYSNLLENYLGYFVPTGDRRLPPPLPQRIYQADNSNYIIPSQSRQNNNMSPEEDRPTLFKASLFQNETMSPEPRSGQIKNPSLESESWRTEVFLNILITVWLSIDNTDASYQFETLLPTVEMVKSIRMIVRHLHHFMNTINTTVQHPLEEVKRNIFPAFQKKMYALLCHLFMRWPLDHSFRIVYETWLSYIQPWRYTDAEITRRAQGDSGGGENSMSLNPAQCNFVLDNLLFYTSLFQQMLHRISRVDLTSIRHSHMLYRITKVYTNIENLKGLICEIEKSIVQDTEAFNSTQNQQSFMINYFGSSSLDLSANASTLNRSFAGSYVPTPPGFVSSSLRLVNVKQLMKELEGHSFHYVPLFSEANRERVAAVVEMINQALNTITNSNFNPSPRESLEGRKWSVWISSFLGQSSSSDLTLVDDNSQDRARLTQFLTLSKNHLVNLFNLVNLDSEHVNASSVGQFQARELLPSCLSGETNFQLGKSVTPGSPGRRRGTGNASFRSEIYGTPEKVQNQDKDESIAGRHGPPISGIGRVEESDCFSPLLMSTTPLSANGNLNTSSEFSLSTRKSPVGLKPSIFSLTSEGTTLSSTWVTVFGFTSSSTSNVINHFSQYGTILESKTNPGSNWIHLKYSNLFETRRALSKNGTIVCGNWIVGVIPCDEEVAKSGTPPGGWGLFNTSTIPSVFGSGNSGDAAVQGRKINAYSEDFPGQEQMRPLGRESVQMEIPQKNNGIFSWALDTIFGW